MGTARGCGALRLPGRPPMTTPLRPATAHSSSRSSAHHRYHGNVMSCDGMLHADRDHEIWHHAHTYEGYARCGGLHRLMALQGFLQT